MEKIGGLGVEDFLESFSELWIYQDIYNMLVEEKPHFNPILFYHPIFRRGYESKSYIADVCVMLILPDKITKFLGTN